MDMNFVFCSGGDKNALRADVGNRRFALIDACPPMCPPLGVCKAVFGHGGGWCEGCNKQAGSGVCKEGVYCQPNRAIDLARTAGVPVTEAFLEVVTELVGDTSREPCMYLLETDSGSISQTHYKHVAEEFAKRPEYTVTPIYPRRRKVVG